MAATNAEEKDIEKIVALCDEVEVLLKNKEDHTHKDIEFHAAIALSSKNVVVPRLIPVINSSIPLFVESTGNTLHKEKLSKLIVRLQMLSQPTTRSAHRMPCIFIWSTTEKGFTLP